MQRRTLLKSAVTASLLTPWVPKVVGQTPAGPTKKGPTKKGATKKGAKRVWRVAVIGHTGRGNYGHGLDTAWQKLENAKIVAVSDPDAAGLESAMKRVGTNSGFTSYEKMLDDVSPDVVAVCPRHPDQHHAMIMKAIAAGARGIYVEKPFCRTPAEADDIQKACKENNTKLAVAHRNRYHPVLPVVDDLIAAGDLGRILEIRARGKGDRRGGAEDLWVLGSHVLNLVHYFGGKPLSCSAIIKKDGRVATAADVYPGSEALGPLVGNELHARFDMERGMIAYFDSIANDETQSAGFGLQIVGSRGLIDFNCDRNPLAYLVPGNPFQPTSEARPWTPISSNGVGKPETRAQLLDDVAHQVEPARDLLASIETDGQPKCDVQAAAVNVEMISAVFASHAAGGKSVSLPLKERKHPLG